MWMTKKDLGVDAFGNTTKDNQIGNQCSGANSTTCDSYFNGTIDDVRVYNRALSAAEVKQLYHMGHP